MKHLLFSWIIFFGLGSLLGSLGGHRSSRAGNIMREKQEALIAEGKSLVKEGDLIVRLNRDPFSQGIKNFNRHDKSYSHAGIVFIENGHPYVYHMVNGEENPDEKLFKEPMAGFCNPAENLAYGIFRYDLDPLEIDSLKAVIGRWYKRGIRFDSAFNQQTDDRMYCSEMVSKALAAATKGRITIPSTLLTAGESLILSARTTLPLSYTSGLAIISIDNLYCLKSCRKICAFKF